METVKSRTNEKLEPKTTPQDPIEYGEEEWLGQRPELTYSIEVEAKVEALVSMNESYPMHFLTHLGQAKKEKALSDLFGLNRPFPLMNEACQICASIHLAQG